MRLLVTGGAGFIGSNFMHFALAAHPDWEITSLDKLTYAGNPDNLADIQSHPGHHFIKGDIADRELVESLLSQGFQVIVNFAAESHVDRSILDPSPFIETNVKGTQVLLEGARHHKVQKFIHVSSDEVYGSLELGSQGSFSEKSPLAPTSPYAASKAAADLLCQAYHHTHHLPVVITRCTNNFGPYQFPEKLIPLVITNALEDKAIPVYGDGLNMRDWIYVEDHCHALDLIIQQGKLGEIYNIGGGNERTNLGLVQEILRVIGKPQDLITFVADRPAHDRRYALDCSKIQALGWKPQHELEAALSKTIDWYRQNEEWWTKIKGGEYRDYYQSMYPNL